MSDIPAVWDELKQLARQPGEQAPGSLLRDPDKLRLLQFQIGGLLVDLNRQPLTDALLDTLIQLAEVSGLVQMRQALFAGGIVNGTENRAALHTALRAPASKRPAQVREPIDRSLALMEKLVQEVHRGTRRGYTGKVFTDLVHIGIGGSHLGPELVVRALEGSMPRQLGVHFVANVDGTALQQSLQALNPETTLFLVVSKTFSTLETRLNAQSARSWFLERTASESALGKHFFAVTANTTNAIEFGIPEDNQFPIWDWVGGRYSLWSAVGLPIALGFGFKAFQALLSGAHQMDQHFLTTDAHQNAPLLLALVGIWNYNFGGIQSHAVLPYDERLALLPDYLQQLEMESNGKRVQKDGSPVIGDTMAILWGNQGTNGQHAFHQLLHQGTRAYSADFIFCRRPAQPLGDHHQWLLANGLAQAQAMTQGFQSDDPQRSIPGGHPVSTLVLDDLSPHNLGLLIALYEHKVFCQGLIWNINSFDQFGVEFGKVLAGPIFQSLNGQATPEPDNITNNLIKHLRSSD